MVLTLIGLALFLCGLAGYVTGRLSSRRYHGMTAWVWLIWGVRDVHAGGSGAAALDAVFFALNAWAWWKDGGGDDTKRRLRSVGRAFSPVRRTAPSPA